MSRIATALLAVVVLAACGTERNMDNPDLVGPGSLETSTSSTTTLPTITAFVPSTAPTTLAPPTAPPTQATYAPTTPPPTPAPTSATLPPVQTIADKYTVVAGDTLSGIAGKLGVSLNGLLVGEQLHSRLADPAGRPARDPGRWHAAHRHDGGAGDEPAGHEPAGDQPAGDERPGDEPARHDGRPGDDGRDRHPPPRSRRPRARSRRASTDATCQAPDSAEANGTPISFNPGNVLDHNPATAWRCESGSDQALTFTFSSPVHLDSVGLIGGYVKVDPLTGVDRFEQNARVRQVEWAFSDGTNTSTATQNLADERSMQTMAVDVVVTTVTMTVTDTYPPGGPASAANGAGRRGAVHRRSRLARIRQPVP